MMLLDYFNFIANATLIVIVNQCDNDSTMSCKLNFA